MKTINSGKVAMTLGGILIATLAAGCYGGGGYYSGHPYGYSRSYSYNSYNSSYPYDGAHGGYSVAPHERVEVRTEIQHSSVDRDKVTLRDAEPANRTEKN